MNKNRNKQRRTGLIATVILLLILVAGFIPIYPQLYKYLINVSKQQITDARDAASWPFEDETEDSGLIKHDRKEDYTEEEIQQNQEVQAQAMEELRQQQSAYDSYREFYLAGIKAEESTEPGSTKERLANIDLLLDEANSNPSDALTRGTIITGEATYRVKEVSYLSEFKAEETFSADSFENPEHFMLREDGTIAAEQGYMLAFVEIEIANEADEVSKNIPVNSFEYWLADEEHTLYTAPFAWGSLKPGVEAHQYFIAELQPHSAEMTTALFVVPADDRFSKYSPYLCVNFGSSIYQPAACGLIPLERFETE